MERGEIINALIGGKCRIGFRWVFEHMRDGQVIHTEIVDNIIPDEGRDYILNAALNGGPQFSTWYIGLYENNYTPVADDSMSDFATVSGEITTGYSQTTRPALVPDDLNAGLWSNAGSKAEFDFTTAKTVRGGFVCSNAVKGGATGVLLSAVLSDDPKSPTNGETLRVTVGLTLISD